MTPAADLAPKPGTIERQVAGICISLFERLRAVPEDEQERLALSTFACALGHLLHCTPAERRGAVMETLVEGAWRATRLCDAMAAERTAGAVH